MNLIFFFLKQVYDLVVHLMGNTMVCSDELIIFMTFEGLLHLNTRG